MLYVKYVTWKLEPMKVTLFIPVCTQNTEDIQDIAYAVKEVNAVSRKPLYNAVLLYQSSILNEAENLWKDSFKGVSEYLIIAVKAQPKEGKYVIIFMLSLNMYNCNYNLLIFTYNNSLTDCTMVSIIAHHSPDSTVHEQHFNFAHNDPRYNMIEVSSNRGMIAYLIKHFSPSNGTVLSSTCEPGKWLRYLSTAL